MSTEVRASAPAKINLSLRVGPARPDGFHPLATVYQAVSLFDEVTVRLSDRPALTVSGDGVEVTGVPTDESNLAWRALELLAEHHRRDLDVSMHLRKRIPVAGGLAGGSTDAAAALVALDALFELHTPRRELLALGATLGSDVPFCLVGGTAIGLGRGEQLTPVMTRGEYWWVVVPDREGLSTPQVYAEFDRLHASAPVEDPDVDEELVAALGAGDARRLGTALGNDLEPAALSLRPELAELLRSGREAGAHGALVSGSGPSTVFLCESVQHADEVDELLQQERGIAPAMVVKGPVPGARLTGGHR